MAEWAASLLGPVLHQREAWLERAVRSALAQTVPCEVIVVTAPATPVTNLVTLDRLRQERAGAGLVVSAAPPGFGAALNHGLRLATADRVGFLLSDDWLEPDAVGACLEAATDIVASNLRVYAADGVTVFEGLERLATQRSFDKLPTLEQKAAYLRHLFLLDRRKVLAVGGLDESLGDGAGIDDYDLIWTLLEHGATVTIVERVLYNYRDHDGERLTTRPVPELVATCARILDKHGVVGEERARLLAAKALWYGRPLHTVPRAAPGLAGAP